MQWCRTVLTNPPFGTKSDKAGIDVQFLRTATRLARRAVYSFHKKSTRNFLLKLIREDWGFPESEVVAEMRFDIQKSYNFHKSKSKDVEVDLIRIFVGGSNASNLDGDDVCDSDEKEGGIKRSDTIHHVDNNHSEERQPYDGGNKEGEESETLT